MICFVLGIRVPGGRGDVRSFLRLQTLSFPAFPQRQRLGGREVVMVFAVVEAGEALPTRREETWWGSRPGYGRLAWQTDLVSPQVCAHNAIRGSRFSFLCRQPKGCQGSTLPWSLPPPRLFPIVGVGTGSILHWPEVPRRWAPTDAIAGGKTANRGR